MAEFLPPDAAINYIEKKYGKRRSKNWLAKLRARPEKG